MIFPDPAFVQRLRRNLLRWYDCEQRRLPWRGERDPYRIWLSEVMLQQTRVAVVIERYQRFLRRFPDIKTLARAKTSAVLSEWSGLGYYRRARRMHQAAGLIVRQGKGIFPRSAAELRELPGIGRYTAAAVASIAFGESAAVVDGNVERVLERLFAGQLAGAESYWRVAGMLLSPSRPGDFNQAMMELGATVCLPLNPICSNCPVRSSCPLRGQFNSAGTRARQPEIRKKLRKSYVLAVRGKTVLLVRRGPKTSLMPGMWELPEISRISIRSQNVIRVRHSITNTDYEVRIQLVHGSELAQAHAGSWKSLAQLDRIPLTGLTRKILNKAGLLQY